MRNQLGSHLAMSGAVFLSIVISATSVHAIDRCKVKVDKKTGVIRVDASGVSGPLLWGTESGSEVNPFFNSGTCVVGTTAKKCELSDPLTLASKTAPSACTLYLDDSGLPCSVWIRGCFPSASEASGIVWKDSTGATIGVTDDYASSATRDDGTAFVRVPVAPDGSGFSVFGQLLYASGDCSGAPLQSPDPTPFKNVYVMGPSGPAYYGPVSGSLQSYGSFQQANSAYVDQAACDLTYGIGITTYNPPLSCCLPFGSSQSLGTALTTTISGFTPPFYIEQQ